VSRPFSPKVVTASDLLTGEAVYLTDDGRWSPRHDAAGLLIDAAEAQRRLAEAEGQPDRVVGAYLADARPGAAGPEPVHVREACRTRGPSNYPHGKQAEAETRPRF
jgi:hypothetical protein